MILYIDGHSGAGYSGGKKRTVRGKRKTEKAEVDKLKSEQLLSIAAELKKRLSKLIEQKAEWKLTVSRAGRRRRLSQINSPTCNGSEHLRRLQSSSPGKRNEFRPEI